MLQFLKSSKFKAFLVVICGLLVGSVIAIATPSGASPVTSTAGLIFSPLQKAASAISQKLDWFAGSFEGTGAYQREIERLEQKIAQYENQLVEHNEALHKLESYENMLAVKEEHPDYSLEPASVIGTDSADMFASLIIDKGSKDGVSADDPVVYGSYVVGTVKKVHTSYSVVETLLNPELNISAMDSKTREIAYVTTTVDYSLKDRCILTGLSRTTSVTPGGIIITSGIGGTYPKGLIIGSVSEVSESKHDLSNYAVIEPGADIRELEDVFVITDFEGQGIEEIIE